MKNEPWRGNTGARLVHVERLLSNKRAELRALNAAHKHALDRIRELVAERGEVLARIESRQIEPHRGRPNIYTPTCGCIDCIGGRNWHEEHAPTPPTT